jgi:hypothetical protein
MPDFKLSQKYKYHRLAVHSYPKRRETDGESYTTDG